MPTAFSGAQIMNSGSVRRLLALPGYENISLELPLKGDSELEVLQTIGQINDHLIDWANIILKSKQVNQGRSIVDALTHETVTIKERIFELSNLTNSK
jgi:uncharacterized coiled-coil DUF342 family protein